MLICWNSGNCIGAVVCARSLLETFGFFHSLLARGTKFANESDWTAVGKLIEAHAFSSGRKGLRRKRDKQFEPFILSKMVINLISATFPGSQQSWEQICDISHPNGESMFFHTVGEISETMKFVEQAERERRSFVPVYNCLHMHCWFFIALSYGDEFIDWCRSGQAPVNTILDEVWTP